MSVVTAKPLTARLNLADVAMLFRVKPRTVLGWVQQRKFPAPLSIGRARLWDVEVIEGLLAGKEGDANAR